jgi:hypothetical protein
VRAFAHPTDVENACQSLRAQGLIELNTHGLQILDVDALKEFENLRVAARTISTCLEAKDRWHDGKRFLFAFLK